MDHVGVVFYESRSRYSYTGRQHLSVNRAFRECKYRIGSTTPSVFWKRPFKNGP